MRASRVAVILAILALLSLVGTAVFVYYPIQLTISPVSPPVFFGSGTNTNGTDLAGNTITVIIGPNATNTSITIHPTYERTYYHDVVRIVNPAVPGGDPYYIAIRVNNPLVGFQQANVKVYDNANNLLFTADLTAAGTYGWATLLPDNTQFRIDIELVIPSGQPLPATTTVTFELVYSPQNAVSPP